MQKRILDFPPWNVWNISKFFKVQGWCTVTCQCPQSTVSFFPPVEQRALLTKLRFSFGILTRKKKLPHFLNVYTFGAARTWGSSGQDLTSIYSIDFSLVVSTHWLFKLFVHQIGSFRQVGGESIYCRWACDPITSAGNPNLTPQRSYCGVASDRKYRERFTTKSFTACKLAMNSELNRRLGALNRTQTWRISQVFGYKLGETHHTQT